MLDRRGAIFLVFIVGSLVGFTLCLHLRVMLGRSDGFGGQVHQDSVCMSISPLKTYFKERRSQAQLYSWRGGKGMSVLSDECHLS